MPAEEPPSSEAPSRHQRHSHSWAANDVRWMLLGGLIGATLTVLAAVAFPLLAGGAIVWIFGIFVVGLINLGLGSLLAGAFIELRKRNESKLTPADLFFLGATLVVSLGADVLLAHYLFNLTSDTSLRWFFLEHLVVFIGAGWLLAQRWLWPNKERERRLVGKPRSQHRLGRLLSTLFAPISILLGTAAGAFVMVVLLLLSAYVDNNSPATGLPIPTGIHIDGTYVALGDSYSSGEGLLPFMTGTVQTGCDRSSSQAYAERLVSAEGWELKSFQACSGAVVHDVLNPVTRNGLPVPAQASGPPQPDVGLVTLTIGGNNALFRELVQRCVLYSDCLNATFPPAGVASPDGVRRGPFESSWIPATLLAIANDDGTLFRALRTDFPHARIIVIGYPYLFPTTSPSWLDPACFSLLRRVDLPVRTELHGLQDELNNLTYEEAIAAHIEFVSPVATWQGHTLCGSTGQWTNSIKPYVDPHPNFDGSFHPNSAGQESIAALIACYLKANSTPPDPFEDGGQYPLTVPSNTYEVPSDLRLNPAPGFASPLAPCAT